MVATLVDFKVAVNLVDDNTKKEFGIKEAKELRERMIKIHKETKCV